MARIHAVGETKNESERAVVEHLRKLPAGYHIFHNLRLNRASGGHLYEYDAIVVSKAYICVIEAKNKGYKNIDGNAVRWELPNGKFEENPVPLTDEKAKILKNRLVEFDADHARLLKQVYIDALVVLCNPNASYRPRDPTAGHVVCLPDLNRRLLAREREMARAAGLDASPTVLRMMKEWFGKPDNRKPQCDQYEVEGKVVGHGPFGSKIYMAEHTLLRSSRGRVTLHAFELDVSRSREGLEEQIDLFVRSARVLEVVGRHPNIVSCFAPCRWEADKIAVPFEWMEGPTLLDCLLKGVDWPFAVRLDIFRQICDGLAHAHRHQVIHWALTPKDIVIRLDEPSRPHVKLMNFHFAKLEDAARSGVQTVGSRFIHEADMRYVVPELYPVAHAATSRADIYSAGMVLFELMASQPHFGDRAMTNQSSPMRPDTRLQRPTALNPDLPPAVDEIFHKMCANASEDRYDSLEIVLSRIAELALA